MEEQYYNFTLTVIAPAGHSTNYGMGILTKLQLNNRIRNQFSEVTEITLADDDCYEIVLITKTGLIIEIFGEPVEDATE